MTGKEIVRETALRTGYTIAVCDEIIKEAFKVMAGALESYDYVKMKNFGTFEVYDRIPRDIYNFATKEVNHIDGYKSIRFIPAAQLKEAVRS